MQQQPVCAVGNQNIHTLDTMFPNFSPTCDQTYTPTSPNPHCQIHSPTCPATNPTSTIRQLVLQKERELLEINHQKVKSLEQQVQELSQRLINKDNEFRVKQNQIIQLRGDLEINQKLLSDEQDQNQNLAKRAMKVQLIFMGE
eukprot:TRINITY_DN17432_c0_g1_i3.p1 TRINITY_DN17432_c0_g1~~TRINITY_DN17432_c0_g1_i3.p1  ORF type:complete len:143 (-),score=17.57 TRINITY_DN17432_c0_g1_i3:24-452(-)